MEDKEFNAMLVNYPKTYNVSIGLLFGHNVRL